MTRWLAAFAAVAFGCSGEAESEPRPSRFVVTAVAGDGDVSVERIADVAEGWAVRWERATGLDVSVSSDGIPVRFLEGLTHEGVERCGYAKLVFELGELDGWYRVEHVLLNTRLPAGCPSWDFTLGHELGHVLAGPGAEHSISGIFRERVDAAHGGFRIDDGALDAVCTHAPCPVFAPESDPNNVEASQ